MSDLGLGRLHAPDARDKTYRMMSFLPTVPPAKTFRYYKLGPILDQGSTGTCVGHAWRSFLSSAPIMTTGGPEPFDIYRGAIAIDEFADNDNDGIAMQMGTSVRAGAKILQSAGYIQNYVWATTIDDMANWILSDKGTIVMGTAWYDGMFTPDNLGFVKISGSVIGGHAYLCIGYSRPKASFKFVNSWGSNWGQKGTFYMSSETVERLLKENGEACTAIEKKVI